MQRWSADLALDVRCTIAEGPHWDARTDELLFVNIDDAEVHRWHPLSGAHQVHVIDQMVGAIAPAAEGRLAAAACHHGLGALDLDTGALDVHWPVDAEHPERRFNDGKAGPDGQLWAGTTTLSGPNHEMATLWRLDSGGRAHQMLKGATISNGLAWTTDTRTFVYIDSATSRIDLFDHDPLTSVLSNRRTLVNIPPDHGSPDGCCLDAEDQLWVAFWGGGRVLRYDLATGGLTGVIDVGVPLVTACAWGGSGLQTLYISTARVSLDAATLAAHPTSGSIFACRPGVQGAAFHTWVPPTH